MSTFTGTNGNDTFTGTTGADTFDLQQGGSDSASGRGGNDLFNLGAAFDALDQIDGGAGNDTLTLDGDYAAGVIFGATTLQNVETIELGTGHSYRLTIADGTVAAGATLQVDGSALGAGDRLVFEGSDERDGSLIITGGAGDDHLIGGDYPGGAAVTDIFDLESGGDDRVTGGDNASNIVNFGATFTADDRVVGSTSSTGGTTIALNGNYAGSHAVTMNDTTMARVDTLRVAAGHSYTLVSGNAALGHDGHTLIDGSTLGAGDYLHFDGSAETAGVFDFNGGAGNDVLVASSGQDNAQGAFFVLAKGGNDTAVGNLYSDTFDLGARLTAADRIDGGDSSDLVMLDGNYTGTRAVTFGVKTMRNVETLSVAAGHSYSLTTDDATVAAGQYLRVDASALAAGNGLTFDGSAESDGGFAFQGGAGNDVLRGGKGDDFFTLDKGGSDTARGGAGDDDFGFGGKFNANDTIDGGAGNDRLNLGGDYSSGVTFTSTTLRNVETLFLEGDHSYKFTTADATVAAGATLSVVATAMAAGDSLDFDGSAESNGSFVVTAGAGKDTIRGGGGSDSVDFGTQFKANDFFNGGAGSDAVTIGKASAPDMVLSNLRNIEDLGLDGDSYHVTTTDGLVAAGANLFVTFGNANGDTLWFDGSAETNGTFGIVGGDGDDHIRGGAEGNGIGGGLGADFLRGGAGHDNYFYDDVSQSTGKTYDTIFGFNANGDDLLVLNGAHVTGVNARIAHGSLSNATFDDDLAATVNASHLLAHHAVLFTPDADSHAGQTFLVIDVNNQAGYQAGADYVMRLQSPLNLGQLSASSFATF